MKISLVIATFGRADELHNLFASLERQDFANLECIVVDQNSDDRVTKIVQDWSERLPLRRITSSPGLSHARNAGLAFATGDIVAFPDDDCWYSEGLLRQVENWFATHPEFGVLTVGAEDHDGSPSGNRWMQNRCEISAANAFRTTFSSTIFVRRTEAMQAVRFDEAVGVGAGTRFCCGEETDYVLNLLRNGARGWFDRNWHIGHPKRDMLSGTVDARRATGYGCGMGHVLRKHSEPLLFAAFLAYDLTRTVAVTVKGDGKAARLCLRHALGIVEGYLGLPALHISSTSWPGRIVEFAGRLMAAPSRRLSN